MLSAFVFLFLSKNIVHTLAKCKTTATADYVPSSPNISIPSASSSIFNNAISRGESELIELSIMDPLDEVITTWSRVDCPHLQDNLLYWENASSWDSGVVPTSSDSEITIPENSKMLITSCSLSYSNNSASNPLQRIVVPLNSSLIFDDANITLHVREIKVYGSLYIGSEKCRYYSNIYIYFHGTKNDSSVLNSDSSKTSKGIRVNAGTIDVHGKQYHPTWTKLSILANAGDNIIYLQDQTNWEVGQEIVVITTSWFDCPPEYEEDWCTPCYSWQTCVTQSHQNEVRTIKAIKNLYNNEIENILCIIELNETLNYEHYAGLEYQAEVALLSRRINFIGYDDVNKESENFGGHVLVTNGGIGRFSGIKGYKMGQKNILGRYPFHMHLNGNSSLSYVQDCSVVESHFRCYVIHGSNYTRLSRNVGYNIWGHCYYLEDGVEENNVIEYNLAAHVHPIYQPADGDGGQGGEQFLQNDNLTIPADTSAAGFYISNSYNSFLGNVASGGWSGFAFPNLPYPIGEFKDLDLGNNNPENRPLLLFESNIAHSSGYYWEAHGGCIYVGGNFDYSDDYPTLLYYDSGRYDRDTILSNGTESWMLFKNTKTFLCNRGINHWGERMIIQYYESHDNLRSAVMFGESTMNIALSNARTNNSLGNWQQEYRWQDREGFQFYDTWVKTILDDITFRNYYNASAGDAVILYMDHSDHYIPQGINAVRNIKFENCNASILNNIGHCGYEYCDDDETMSARIAAVYDYDGSLSLTYKKSILGSHRNWWNISKDCEFTQWNIWRCNWYETRQIAYIDPYVPGLLDGCDSDVSSTCTDQYASYSVGYVSQWGRNYSIEYGPWTGVAGFANTGWYLRLYKGAPNYMTIGSSLQIPRNNFVVLAIKYPSNTSFNITIKSNWWGYNYGSISMASSLNYVLTNNETLLHPNNMSCSTGYWYSFCEKTGGIGPTWYFDGNYLYLRVVNLYCYNRNTYISCYNGYYEYDNIKIWDINNAFSYVINATCSSCTYVDYNGIKYFDVTDVIPPTFFPVKSDVTLQPTPAPTKYPTPVPTPRPTATTIISSPTSNTGGGTGNGNGNETGNGNGNGNGTGDGDNFSSNNNSSDNLMTIIGVTIGLFFALLIVVGIIYYYRKKKNSNNANQNKKMQENAFKNDFNATINQPTTQTHVIPVSNDQEGPTTTTNGNKPPLPSSFKSKTQVQSSSPPPPMMSQAVPTTTNAKPPLPSNQGGAKPPPPRPKAPPKRP